jgi:hypothetical protein
MKPVNPGIPNTGQYLNNMRNLTTMIFAALIIVLLVLINCNRCNPPEGFPARKDTISTKTDSTITYKPIDSSGWHEPTYNVTLLQGGRIPDETKPEVFIQYEPLPFDTNILVRPYIDQYNTLLESYLKLWDDYNKVRKYSDTSRLPNGKVIVDGVVKNNRLSLINTFLDSVKQITYTNTITLREPPRMKGFLTGGFGFNQLGFRSAEGGLMLQFKNGNGVELSSEFSPSRLKQEQWEHNISFKKLISFNKRKK